MHLAKGRMIGRVRNRNAARASIVLACLGAALALAPGASGDVFLLKEDSSARFGQRLYRAADDGSRARPLRLPGVVRGEVPTSISPGGKLALFSSGGRKAVVRIRDRRVLARRSGPRCGGQLRWSADSRRFACAGLESTRLHVFEAASLRAATLSDSRILGFAFNPAGTEIAWGEGSELLAASASGGHRRTVATVPDSRKAFALGDWGPTDLALTYGDANHWRDSGTTRSPADVWLMRPDGSELRQLTRLPSGPCENASIFDDLQWSRDGRRLLAGRGYLRVRSGDQQPEPPEDPPEEEPQPEEEPLARASITCDTKEGTEFAGGIYAIDPASGEYRFLAPRDSLEPLLARDGRHFLTTNEQTVSVVSVDTGRARRIARRTSHIGWTR